MKKLLIISIVCWGMLTETAVLAQDRAAISLQFALDNAIKHRNEIKMQQLNADNSANEISKANSKLLPQLTSDIDARYNGRLQTNIIPGEAFGAIGSPARKVAFGTKYNTLVSFNLTIPIYNPTDFSDRKIARVQAAYDQMNVQKSETDVKADVMQSYFNGLINKEKLKLSKINMDQALSVYMMAQDQLKKGIITTNDLEKNRIDYENARSDYNKNSNTYHLALADLVYRMGLDYHDDPVQTDSLSGLYTQYANIMEDNRPSKRVELKMQKLQEDIYGENIKKQNKSYLPTLSAYGNFTAQNLNNSFTPFSNGSLYPYNYVGIRMSIPVFDGFLKARTKRGDRLQLESARVNTDKLTRDYAYEVKSSCTALLNDLQEMNNQQNNLKHALSLYQTDADGYRRGVIKPSDLSATYYTLQQTQNNYLNAIYSYLLDVVNYKKALGVL